MARKYQMHLSKPIKRPADRDAFWHDYLNSGFENVAGKYLRYSIKYKLLIRLYNMANKLKNKRIAQKIGSSIFY